MAVVLAVEDLLRKIREEFEVEAIEVPNLFGWRTPAQQLVTGPRITWVPGNRKAGDLGKFGAAKWPGRNPRPLANLDEVFTVTIVGFDLKDPENEEKQYHETRLLFDAWYRALYHAAYGTFSILSANWVVNRKERRAGAAIEVLLALQAKISDAAHHVLPANAGAAEIEISFVESPITEATPEPEEVPDVPLEISSS